MKFEDLLLAVGGQPLFETGLLMAGDVDPADVRRQLSRWTAAGRLHQLRRGLYALAPPYRQLAPHPFVVANRLATGSYVSLQAALAHHGAIPEHVAVVTSVHAGRTVRYRTPLGEYEYRHLAPRLLGGFVSESAGGLPVRVASLEKAFLDLVYLEPAADAAPYLQELRLQNLEQVDLARLQREAARFGRPKTFRAAAWLAAAAADERGMPR